MREWLHSPTVVQPIFLHVLYLVSVQSILDLAIKHYLDETNFTR
jgi:hypothetical protein